jgi:hypothetical protein
MRLTSAAFCAKSLQDGQGSRWKRTSLDLGSRLHHPMVRLSSVGSSTDLSKFDECSASSTQESLAPAKIMPPVELKHESLVEDHCQESSDSTQGSSEASQETKSGHRHSLDEGTKTQSKTLTLFGYLSERPWLLGLRRSSQARRSSNLALQVVHSMVDGKISPPEAGSDPPDTQVNEQPSPTVAALTRRAISGSSGKNWGMLWLVTSESDQPPTLNPDASPNDVKQRRRIFSFAGNPIFSALASRLKRSASPPPLR